MHSIFIRLHKEAMFIHKHITHTQAFETEFFLL